MFAGRYHDGRTAATHAVTVTAAADGLEIAGEGGVRAFWRRQDIVVRSRGVREWRLGLSTDPDARLALPRGTEADAALQGLAVGARDALNGWVVVGSLVGAGAVLTGLLFFAIPAAAGPLARATPVAVEQRFGESMEAQIRVLMRPCRGPAADAARAAVAPLAARLAGVAGAEVPVEVDFVRAADPNAFALPGGQVMVTSGLLAALDSPDAFTGVLAHEIGHVQARDGMVALYRNAGLGILLELVTGGTGLAQQVVAVGGQLAELRYTRGQEERADEAAIAMMRASGYDPAGLADAFQSLKEAIGEGDDARTEGRGFAPPEWLLSHPDLDSRIARARAAATPATAVTLTDVEWAAVRGACSR
jgi:Zn-dependent protease with chaperone function